MISALRRFRSDVWQLHLFPVSVEAILETLVQYAQPLVVICGLHYLAYHQPGGQRAERSVVHLAQHVRITYRRHPARDDLLVIQREDLAALLDPIYHWNFHCWDTARVPLPSVLAKQAEIIKRAGRRRQDTAMLHLLDGARVFMDSHDDAYLTVEGRDPSFVRTVFANALRSYAAQTIAGALHRLDPPEPVADMPDQVIDYFWTPAHGWEFRPVQIRGSGPRVERVRLGFAPTGPGLEGWIGTREFVPTGHLDYNVRHRGWRLRYH